MKIIIAGSRTVVEQEVRTALNCCPWIGFVTAVVSGTSKGADEFGEHWAQENGIEIIRFPADWSKYGRRAGPIRNKVMAENAEGLIAIWDGKSRGTQSMINLASELGLRIFILRTDTNVIENRLPKGHLEDIWMSAEEKAAIQEYMAGFPKLEAERAAGKQFRENTKTQD